MAAELKIFRKVCARVPNDNGTFQLCLYLNNQDDKENLAYIFGSLAESEEPVLVRIHSECFTGDVLGSRRCDCGDQLHQAMALIAKAGTGVLIYLRQEGRGIGLLAKLRAYNLQDQGADTVDANLLLGHDVDNRDYSMAIAILNDLGIKKIRLMTNNPDKITAMVEGGIEVVERVPLVVAATKENIAYLRTKAERMHHLIDLEGLRWAELNSHTE